MNNKEFLDQLTNQEKANPTFSKHNPNSYLSNQPVAHNNFELKKILKYFDSPKTYMSLNASEEFNTSLSIDIKIEQLNIIDKKQNITYRKSLYHNHDFFEMVYVYAGTCKTVINNHSINLNTGNLCLFDLQTVHQLIIPNDETKVFNILISQELLTSTFLQLLDNNDFIANFFINSIYNIPKQNEYLIFNLSEDEITIFYLEQILIEFFKQKPFYNGVIQSLLAALFLSLARIYQSKITNLTKQNTGKIEITQLLQYIQDNYQNITLKQLAEHFGYTTRTMMRFLQNYTGHTFSEILKDFRLQNACYYLKNTSSSIDEIAQMTGFCDRSYFDKVFKQTYHLTPKEYRDK
ncbi:MAG TPA: AraC family transcriptional regulator [Candidatus Erysipelatoclostridium merdavium]|uniref:AraC family transcriptional regulator n=1 Tax=Candidatus Erysipelatoclostridium merdavium TaxID=2838566 RepID=A0A9D1XN96_9FIRM|nr:AraC family transcriptional regulator [Candidatus Erysipelatoclostridium merdavium]